MRGYDNSASVSVEIRNMVNGYPGTTRYAIKTVSASQIKTSPDGTAETVFTFDDPVLCEANMQYCIIVTCSSPKTFLYVAKMGEKDLATRTQVTTQADANGVLFTSSNALTWTAEQLMD